LGGLYQFTRLGPGSEENGSGTPAHGHVEYVLHKFRGVVSNGETVRDTLTGRVGSYVFFNFNIVFRGVLL
jgi:hypothetical protein